MIILGAQPGAGKTELEKIAREELGGNAVICNADLFRDQHPKAEQFKQEQEEKYPELTAPYAIAWNNGLREYCEAHRLNYILETTFSSGEQMNNTIIALKAKAYQVRIKLLAVHPSLSLLGTYLRFERMKAIEGGGRLVGKVAHDERFLKIESTIQSVAAAGRYNDLKLYARNANDEGKLQLIADNPVNVLQAFRQEIAREWTQEVKTKFDLEIGHIIELMRKRKAPQKEITAFINAIQAPFERQADESLRQNPEFHQRRSRGR